MGEVHRQHAFGEHGILLERLLGGEQPGGHDDRVEAPQRLGGLVEGIAEGAGLLQVAAGRADRLGGAAHLQIAGAAIQFFFLAPQKEKALAPFRHEPCQCAAHPLGGPQEDGPHAGSPSSRTDWALRIRNPGSHLRRTASQASRRGSMARKCSGRVKASLLK